MTDVLDELEQLQATPRQLLEQILRKRAREAVDGLQTDATYQRLVGWLAGFIGLANLRGRVQVLTEADRLPRQVGTTPPPVPPAPVSIDVSPDFPERTPFVFREAIKSIVEREPRLAPDAARVAEAMRRGGFATARSADVRLTKRVQAEIAKMERLGLSTKSTSKVVQRISGWTEAYADTVVETNAATAYTSGRMDQARRPAVKAVAPAFELIGPKDSDTRRNHYFAVGLIAGTDDPIWREFAPPLGYRCRHGLSLVPVMELERRGLIDQFGQVTRYLPPGFEKAHRDPGFANVLS